MRIAFVFPGQGSQSVGMLGGFADNETVRGALARADEALGFSIERLIAEGPAEELNLTVNTQPAVLASSVAFYEAWLAAGGQKPELLAGHSLGEYSALCAAGVFPLEEAVKLVRFRADVVELHPQVAVICGGTNDLAQNTGYISLEHILDNIQSMAELARANGIRPVLCSVLPAGDFPWRPGLEPAQKIVRLNAMIRAYAEREGIPYVDYHAALDNGSGGLDARISRDGCHPTLYGYTLMEPMVVEGINKALRTKQARYTTPIPNE